MVRAGQRLHDARVRKKLSIEDVAKATKIRPAFLTAIEKGEYNKLPSSAYAVGFVRNYATFLDLPEREILAVFRREFDEDKVFTVLPDSMTSNDFPRHSVRIQQTILVLIAILFVFFAYIGYQYRFLVVNPPLTVTSPENNITSDSTDITISGKTDSNASVFVNNTPVTIDSEGNFSKRVTFFPGKGKITITAVNRIGKTTQVIRTVTIKKADE